MNCPHFLEPQFRPWKVDFSKKFLPEKQKQDGLALEVILEFQRISLSYFVASYWMEWKTWSLELQKQVSELILVLQHLYLE